MGRRIAGASTFVAGMIFATFAHADEPPVPEAPEEAPALPTEEPVFILPPPPTMNVTREASVPQARPSSSNALHKGLGFALVGSGVLATTVGILLAASAKSTYDDAVASCVDLRCPSDDATRANDARTQANVGGYVMIGGLVAVGAGVLLWLTAPSGSNVVVTSRGLGSVMTGGRF